MNGRPLCGKRLRECTYLLLGTGRLAYTVMYRTMKKGFIILAAVVLLLSCGGKTQTAEQDSVDQQWTERRIESATADSTEIRSYESTSSQRDMSSPAPSSSSSYSSRSYDAEEEEEEDGMRHFDPASEDDMDDNGMSRFMENNDEEGWD